MRHDLTDTTFVIPFTADSGERLENCQTIVRYLNKYFDTNVLLVESADPEIWEEDSNQCKHLYVESDVFHRTKYLNEGYKAATTPFVVNYDTDVLFPVQAYLDARQLLIDNPDCVFAFPFDGRFYNLIGEVRKSVIETLDVENLGIAQGHWVHYQSLGGAIFINKENYRQIGYENPNFVGWGYEDDERVARAQKLGYSIKRAPYILWHLDHPRKGTFYESSQPFVLDYVKRLTPEQLREHIKGWDN
jgi:hypothetical protein